MWRTLAPEAEPRSQILMPPMEWGLQADDAAAILSAVATSIRAGLAAPRPLTAVIAESEAVPQQDRPSAARRCARATRGPASTTR